MRWATEKFSVAHFFIFTKRTGMKNYIIQIIAIVAAICLNNNLLIGQNHFTVELKLIASDTTNKPIVKLPLIVGIDGRATDSMDYEIGEQAFPQHPPSGFHAGLLINDELSYKDYRRIPPQKLFKIQYELNVSAKDPNRQDQPFYLTWEYPLSKYIDSARFTDRLDGSIVSFPIDSKQASPLIYTPLTTYYINVWYNVGSVNVNELNNDLLADKVMYNAQSDVISIQSVKKNSTISLYSSVASLIRKENFNESNNEINVHNLSNGIYFLAITKPNGITSSHKIMIIR